MKTLRLMRSLILKYSIFYVWQWRLLSNWWQIGLEISLRFCCVLLWWMRKLLSIFGVNWDGSIFGKSHQFPRFILKPHSFSLLKNDTFSKITVLYNDNYRIIMHSILEWRAKWFYIKKKFFLIDTISTSSLNYYY